MKCQNHTEKVWAKATTWKTFCQALAPDEADTLGGVVSLTDRTWATLFTSLTDSGVRRLGAWSTATVLAFLARAPVESPLAACGLLICSLAAGRGLAAPSPLGRVARHAAVLVLNKVAILVVASTLVAPTLPLSLVPRLSRYSGLAALFPLKLILNQLCLQLWGVKVIKKQSQIFIPPPTSLVWCFLHSHQTRNQGSCLGPSRDLGTVGALLQDPGRTFPGNVVQTKSNKVETIESDRSSAIEGGQGARRGGA